MYCYNKVTDRKEHALKETQILNWMNLGSIGRKAEEREEGEFTRWH